MPIIKACNKTVMSAVTPILTALLAPGLAVAAVPPDAQIPSQFTGVWAEQADHCLDLKNQPSLLLAPEGFRGLPGEKAYPKVKRLSRDGRHIRVSFYNSNGPLSWRSTETFRLSDGDQRLEYRFAGGTLNWVRCSGPIDSE